MNAEAIKTQIVKCHRCPLRKLVDGSFICTRAGLNIVDVAASSSCPLMKKPEPVQDPVQAPVQVTTPRTRSTGTRGGCGCGRIRK